MDKAAASAAAARAPPPPGPEVAHLPFDHIEEHRLHIANEWRAAPRTLRRLYASFAPGLYRVLVATVTTRGHKDKTLFHGVLPFAALELVAPPGRSRSEPASPAVPADPAAPPFLRSHHLDAHRATHLTTAPLTAQPVALDAERVASIAVEITLLPDSARAAPGGSVLKFTSQAAAHPAPLVALVDDAGVLVAHTPTPATSAPLASARFRPTSLHKRLYEQKLAPEPFLPPPDGPVDDVAQERNEVSRKRKLYRAEPYDVPSETEVLTYSRSVPAPFAAPRPPASPPRAFGAALLLNEQRRQIARLDWHLVALYSALAGLFLWEFALALKHVFH